MASQPRKTATCRIDWDSTPAHVTSLSSGATDSDLLGLFKHANKIGIDAPFGWPRPFVQAIQRYSTAKEWPAVGIRHLRYRRTDYAARDKLDRWPLSVSSDRIAVTAMRLARLFDAAARTGEAIDRTGGGRFVEVYPAAALSVWDFRSRGYKGPENREALTQLVRDFAGVTKAWLQLTEGDWAKCRASDDVFDALVAALVARAAAIGFCEPIASEDLDRAAEEGWIALPQSGSLERLGGGITTAAFWPVTETDMGGYGPPTLHHLMPSGTHDSRPVTNGSRERQHAASHTDADASG